MDFSADIIAFDFDDTLIGQANSKMFHNYILAHPEKTYFVVTHRTRSEAETLGDELSQQTPLTLDHFTRVFTLPDRIKVEFDQDQALRRHAGLPLLQNVDPSMALPGEVNMMLWKGYVCRKAGARVLVDDLPWLQSLGCKKYNVTLFDARKLRVVG